MGELSLAKGMKAKENQQLVSERMELKSKGIGAVAMAGKSIGAKITLKFLDPIFALSAVVIAVIDLFGSTGAVGNDKADVCPQRTDFDFDHNPSSFVPGSGPVAKAIEESNRSFGTGVFALGFVNPALGSFLEYRVGGDPDAANKMIHPKVLEISRRAFRRIPRSGRSLEWPSRHRPGS